MEGSVVLLSRALIEIWLLGGRDVVEMWMGICLLLSYCSQIRIT